MINYLDNDLIDFAIREKIDGMGEDAPEDHIDFEAFILGCIIECQRKDTAKKQDWSFRQNGIRELEGKFSVLISSHDQAHREQIERLVLRWGEFLLSGEENREYGGVPEEQRATWLMEKVTQTVRSLWFLFVGICRLLQENENFISAEEAYWIGLVDEIIGRPDLPSPRMLVEFATATVPE
jgi:hypothetical protein